MADERELATIRGRIERAQQVMARQGVDYLFVTPSPDLVYLLDYPAHASERMTLLAVPRSGQPLILAPELEAPRLEEKRSLLAIHPWGETQQPAQLAANLLPNLNGATIAISDVTWAVFLLRLMQAMPQARFVPGDTVLRELRMVKDAQELEYLRIASQRTDQVWQATLDRVPFVGQSETMVAAQMTELMAEFGLAGPEFLIVASGPNSASPHHITGARVIQPGDAVVIDFGGRYHHYVSDLTRTVHVGEPSDEFRRVYETVLRANEAAFAATRPGAECQAVDRAARTVIADAGYGDYFIHRVGHGIGVDVHEEPYMVEGNTQTLAPGMVYTDEPGIYLPGRFGVRIEDVVVVTERGAEKYNHAGRTLTVVE
ncbi:MAG TPA: Xaa-Pro peptidase family protein [Thermomicrobiaceae bacterium]|nr:Xaa-Pro peptidase family protein [Thermomicrobiaceae bacterium]